MANHTLEFNGRRYHADAWTDISIPLRFNGVQPNAYGTARAASEPVRAGSLIGDTRQGGSCNFEEYRFIPHCNGTHTECVGHITDERISVAECLGQPLFEALIVSVTPEKPGLFSDRYAVAISETDRIITKAALREALIAANGVMPGSCDALVVRTLPNPAKKLAQEYIEDVPAFFSNDAVELMVELGVKHLVTDIPSIDRMFDEGTLSNHRIFWKMEAGAKTASAYSRSRTVTEFAYIPDAVPDGRYLLNIQIPPFVSDAAPSRVMVTPLLSSE